MLYFTFSKPYFQTGFTIEFRRAEFFGIERNCTEIRGVKQLANQSKYKRAKVEKETLPSLTK